MPLALLSVVTGSIPRLIEHQAAINGNSPALMAGAVVITYRELNFRANTVARRLLAHGFRRGGRAYVSNALLRGRFALRASVTNFRTTRRDLELTLEEVARAARGETS